MARKISKNRRRAEEQQAADALKARAEFLRQRKLSSHRRSLLLTLVPILGLILAWLGFGVFREGYWEPRQPVARVEGDAVTASDFGKRVQYGRRQMLANLNNLLSMISTSDTSFITDYAGGQRTNLPQTTLDSMIDEVLIRKEAERRGIEVTDEDVQARIRKDLIEAIEGPAAAADTEAEAPAEAGDADASGEEGATDTDAVTDTATADASGEEGATDTDAVTDTAAAETSDAELERYFERLIQPLLTDAGMSRGDYEKIVRAQLYAEKLGEALGEEVADTAPQVEADYLLFGSDQDAEAALAALEAGATWDEAVARFQPPAEPAADEAAPEGEAAEGDAADDEVAEPTAEPTVEPTEEPTAEPTSAAAQSTDAVTDTTAAAGSTDAMTDTTATDAEAAADAEDATGDDAAAEAAPDEPVFAVEVGERRWYTAAALVERLALTQADADAVLLLKEGETSEAVTGSRGTYVLRVQAADDARALEETELQALKDGALDKWLADQRTAKSGEISRFPLTGLIPDEPEWFVAQYDQIVGGAASQQPIALPTVAPSVEQAPAGDAAGSDGGG